MWNQESRGVTWFTLSPSEIHTLVCRHIAHPGAETGDFHRSCTAPEGPGYPDRREAAAGRGHGPADRGADGSGARFRPAARPAGLAAGPGRAAGAPGTPAGDAGHPRGPRAPHLVRAVGAVGPAPPRRRGSVPDLGGQPPPARDHDRAGPRPRPGSVPRRRHPGAPLAADRADGADPGHGAAGGGLRRETARAGGGDVRRGVAGPPAADRAAVRLRLAALGAGASRPRRSRRDRPVARTPDARRPAPGEPERAVRSSGSGVRRG